MKDDGGVRHSDPHTAIVASEKVNTEALRQEVLDTLEAMKRRGGTWDDVCKALPHQLARSISPRFIELMERWLVYRIEVDREGREIGRVIGPIAAHRKKVKYRSRPGLVNPRGRQQINYFMRKNLI